MLKHSIRHKDGKLVDVMLNRGRAIKAHCTECMGYDNPKECTSKNCALYHYRGKTLMAIKTRKENDNVQN